MWGDSAHMETVSSEKPGSAAAAHTAVTAILLPLSALSQEDRQFQSKEQASPTWPYKVWSLSSVKQL